MGKKARGKVRKPWYDIALASLEKEVGSLPETDVELLREVIVYDSVNILHYFDRAFGIAMLLVDAKQDIPDKHRARVLSTAKQSLRQARIALNRACKIKEALHEELLLED